MELRFTRSATKHRISHGRSAHVIEHYRAVGLVAATATEPERFVFVGDDAGGVALEVIAIPLAVDGLLVIHAMRLRPKYSHI